MEGVEWIVSLVSLIAMILLIRWIFKEKLSARMRYFLWLIVLVRLLVPVSFAGSNVSVLNLMPQNILEGKTDLARENNSYPKYAGDGFVSAEKETASEGKKEDAPVSEPKEEKAQVGAPTMAMPKEKVNWQDITVVIWTAGMAIAATVIVTSNVHFGVKMRRYRKRFEGEEKVGGLPIYVTELVSTPCLFGVLRPAMYIRPVDAANQQTLNHIFLHEHTHFKHGDHIWAVLRCVCLILHWYNPLVWVAAYLSKQDGELACDESVTAAMSDEERQQYGKLLISLTTKRVDYGEILHCATTMTGGKRSMKERILRIAKQPKMLFVSALLVVALCLVVVALTFTGAKETAKTLTDESGQMESTENTEFLDEVESETETEPATSHEQDAEPEKIVDLVQPRIFVNDFLMDINGDGIKDIVRLESVDSMDDVEIVTANRESLLESLRTNVAGYMELTLYDGALACENMDNFKVGDELPKEAFVEIIGDCAHSHVGNKQYCYYEENGRGYIVGNSPYVGQGAGGYYYEVFTYNNNWERVITAEQHLRFATDCWAGSGVWSGEMDTFYKEDFPIEEMVKYTLDLKGYLDKAITMVDTSMGELENFTVTTHFDTEGLTPDAYDIWHWYVGTPVSGVALSDVQTPEELITSLEGIRMANWLYSQFFFLEEGKRTIKIQEVTENATEMPSYVEDVANKHCETLFEIHKDGKLGEFSGWKIPEIKWTYTWDLNGRLVDVYNYRMYLYTDKPESVVYVGGMESRENGWFECDYGLCVAYDRESGQCFTVGGNDTLPTDYNFLVDMISKQWDLFKGIYK